ncbi:MAG TPA: ATP-binding protein [Dehalococcoidia bacterium]|nr:ATP-binding protein [Dehalococcoidia bacterium]
MRCIKCRGKASVDIRRHNSAFCREHFFEYFENQVRRAIDEYDMMRPADRVLVAVSGGKDSLALWDVLLRLGYRADGLYIDLGIGEYSAESKRLTQKFAAERGATLHVVTVAEEFGHPVPELARAVRRVPCAACGTTKRYTFNRTARELGYDVLATGHNLDDEAAALLGNLVHWNMDYLARQCPALPAGNGLVKKVKPLYRLGERETASYAVLRGIDYMVDECPHAVGNQQLQYKEALNLMERDSPGTKHALLFGFLEKGRPHFQAPDLPPLRACDECGEPTTAPVCNQCRLVARARAFYERIDLRPAERPSEPAAPTQR